MKTVEWLVLTGGELFWHLFQSSRGEVFVQIQCAYFLIRNPVQLERKMFIYEELASLARGLLVNGVNEFNYKDLSKLADLFLHSGEEGNFMRLGEEILIAVRAYENLHHMRVQIEDYGKGFVYDTNVHNTNINNSVLNIINSLCNDRHEITDEYDILYKRPLEIIEDILKELNKIKDNKTKTIKAVLNNIAVDQSTFGKYNIRIRDVLQKVWHRICNRIKPELRNDAIIRLRDELYDAHNFCSTGHVSRIVNTLTGFTENEGGVTIVATINWQLEITNAIKLQIQKELEKKENEDYLTFMISDCKEDKDKYFEFLEKIKTDIYKKLVVDFDATFKDRNNDLNIEKFNNIFEESYKSLIK